ncbi:MAG: hypothetical protein NVS2B4_02000 [Ramlibacter sp.]
MSHKGVARAALLAAMGELPVTMRVLHRLQPDGTRAWYVQASIDLPTGFEPETAASREAGVLGLDFNARGVAWCAVKPDGNMVPESKPLPARKSSLRRRCRPQDRRDGSQPGNTSTSGGSSVALGKISSSAKKKATPASWSGL